MRINFIVCFTRKRYYQDEKVKFVPPSGHVMTFCLLYRIEIDEIAMMISSFTCMVKMISSPLSYNIFITTGNLNLSLFVNTYMRKPGAVFHRSLSKYKCMFLTNLNLIHMFGSCAIREVCISKWPDVYMGRIYVIFANQLH